MKIELTENQYLLLESFIRDNEELFTNDDDRMIIDQKSNDVYRELVQKFKYFKSE